MIGVSPSRQSAVNRHRRRSAGHFLVPRHLPLCRWACGCVAGGGPILHRLRAHKRRFRAAATLDGGITRRWDGAALAGLATRTHRSPARTGPCTFNAVGLLPSDMESRRSPGSHPTSLVCVASLTLPYLGSARARDRIGGYVGRPLVWRTAITTLSGRSLIARQLRCTLHTARDDDPSRGGATLFLVSAAQRRSQA